MTAVTARDVTMSHGHGRETYRAVEDVSIEIQEGELVSVIGANGAGKSTLCRAIAGLIEPDAGTVELFGRDITCIRPRERARLISYLPQETETDTPYTVAELMELSRYAWIGTDEERRCAEASRGAMETAGVTQFADRPLRELSGGERRRAMIAASAAQGARCAVFDEPCAYLDVASSAETESVLMSMNRDMGVTVMTVTHDINAALRISTRVIAMKRGRVVWSGCPSALEGTAGSDILRDVYGVELDVYTSADGRSIFAPVHSRSA